MNELGVTPIYIDLKNEWELFSTAAVDRPEKSQKSHKEKDGYQWKKV